MYKSNALQLTPSRRQWQAQKIQCTAEDPSQRFSGNLSKQSVLRYQTYGLLQWLHNPCPSLPIWPIHCKLKCSENRTNNTHSKFLTKQNIKTSTYTFEEKKNTKFRHVGSFVMATGISRDGLYTVHMV